MPCCYVQFSLPSLQHVWSFLKVFFCTSETWSNACTANMYSKLRTSQILQAVFALRPNTERVHIFQALGDDNHFSSQIQTHESLRFTNNSRRQRDSAKRNCLTHTASAIEDKTSQNCVHKRQHLQTKLTKKLFLPTMQNNVCVTQ